MGLSMRDFFPTLAPSSAVAQHSSVSAPADDAPPASSSAWGAPRPSTHTQPAAQAAAMAVAPPQDAEQAKPVTADLDEDGMPRISKREKKRQAAAAAAAAAAASVVVSSRPPPVVTPAFAAPVPVGLWTPASSTLPSSPSSSLDMRVAAVLRARKSAGLVQQLSSLGFPAPLCDAAVRRFGGDMDSAAGWLMDGAPGRTAADTSGGAAASAPLSLAEELAAMDDICSLGFDRQHVRQAVVDTDGDLDAAVVVLLEAAAGGLDTEHSPASPLQPTQPQLWSPMPPEQPRTPVPPSEPPPPLSALSPSFGGSGSGSGSASGLAGFSTSGAAGRTSGGTTSTSLWSSQTSFGDRPAGDVPSLGLGSFTGGLFSRPATNTSSLFGAPVPSKGPGLGQSLGGLGGFGGLWGGSGESSSLWSSKPANGTNGSALWTSPAPTQGLFASAPSSRLAGYGVRDGTDGGQ